MKLYVMRHGQTDWNIRQVYQGQTDIPLNETGLAQAQAAKEKVWPGMADLILCSSLTRARQTAAAVNEVLRVPVIYRPDMKERYFGEWEGSSYVEKRAHPYVASGDYDNYCCTERVAGIELCREVCERAWALLREVKEYYADRSVLLVSHGSWLRAMSAYFRGLDETGSVGHVRMDNCEIKEYEL
ncbi:MAG: histidine phosphatase family protein [Lachnospiraceae bacterium]|nr:histidine phosphatase family protein [Lachnospiraceae bacterium]